MSSVKKKVIISACILGEYCRYDGKTKKIEAVVEKYKDYEIIPFCPEAPLFGTPRERIDVVVDGGEYCIKKESGEDVTAPLFDAIEAFIKEHPHADAIVLKAKSPSCGNGTTPLLDAERNIIGYGDGIAASLFKEHYKKTPFFDENSLNLYLIH